MKGERSVGRELDRSGRIDVPNPCSPDPALFEIAVRFLMSFLFARAPMRVSGVPQSPNPRQGRKERVTPKNV